MKQSTLLICVAVSLLHFTNTNGHHLSSSHIGTSPSLGVVNSIPSAIPNKFASTAGLGLFAPTMIIAKMSFFTAHPELLCITPPSIIIDLLTRVSDPAIMSFMPKEVISSFLLSVKSSPNFSNSIPPSIYTSVYQTMSVSPPAVSSGPGISAISHSSAAVGAPCVPQSQSGIPAIAATDTKTLDVVPGGVPSSSAGSGIPAISATNQKTLDVVPGGVPSSPAGPGVPAISATETKTLDVVPGGVPSSPAGSGVPAISATNQKTLDVVPGGVPSSPGGSGVPAISATETKTLDVVPAGVPSSPAGSGIPAVSATNQKTLDVVPGGVPSSPAGSGVPAISATDTKTLNVIPGGVPSTPGSLSPPCQSSVPGSAVPAVAVSSQQTLNVNSPSSQSSGTFIDILNKLLHHKTSGGFTKVGNPTKKPIIPITVNDPSKIFVLIPSLPKPSIKPDHILNAIHKTGAIIHKKLQDSFKIQPISKMNLVKPPVIPTLTKSSIKCPLLPKLPC